MKMDPLGNSRAVAQELVSFAQEQGVDLEPLLNDDMFVTDKRWIWFWRKDPLPGTGPANEPLGTLHYNMQGAISVLPSKLKDSASAFRGAWTEAGTFESVEQGFALVKAWLLDRKEVDDLPSRSARRYGI
jgi:hypothetical protein